MDIAVVLIVILVLAVAIYANAMWLAGILGIILVMVVMVSGGGKKSKKEKVPEPQVQVPMGGGYPQWSEIKSLLVDAGETAGNVSKNWLASGKFQEITNDFIKEKIAKPIKTSLGVEGSSKSTLMTIGDKDYEIDPKSLGDFQKKFNLSNDQVVEVIAKAFTSYYSTETKK